MGIRYYAYAFDHDDTDRALADPRAFVSEDPLADAWGFEPHARVATPTFSQAVSERDMLYLDKSWSHLQLLTCPESACTARPAYRMFEGGVTMYADGWEPWIRPLRPEEVAIIAPDVVSVLDEAVSDRRRDADVPDWDYALTYLRRASEFVTNLAAERRGMVYLIG